MFNTYRVMGDYQPIESDIFYRRSFDRIVVATDLIDAIQTCQRNLCRAVVTFAALKDMDVINWIQCNVTVVKDEDEDCEADFSI